MHNLCGTAGKRHCCKECAALARRGNRIRYSAGYANIELAVDGEGELRHLEGEIYPQGEQAGLLLDTGPALITLLHHGEIVAETISDTDGRFGFDDLTTGDYAMTLFLHDKSRIELVVVNVS